MSTQSTLTVTAQVLQQIGEHAISCYPEEACGLLVGRSATSEVVEFHPCENITHSAKVYTINPKQHLVIERNAEDAGFDVVGVVHSHTHTEAYPSSTDVAQAPDPGWHYMIVTLKRGVPEPRNFRIIDGVISETEIIQHN
ncbi:MAG: M67 family metallopeptidase [Actinomycetota bacterium]|jgi:[CysO sulfur-carrier protein]-S-L-cysteine hydrolase|nr:M67 family metallopeptidase [Actinomycetota bacterium]MDA2998646.1 M67 family metallopeptidase [Actinomycetota bacterium]